MFFDVELLERLFLAFFVAVRLSVLNFGMLMLMLTMVMVLGVLLVLGLL